MKKIAILCGRYLPGIKDGGPVRTLINLCECLGKEYEIKIITNDRDHGDIKAYPNIKYDEPNIVGNATVWYLPPKGFTFKKIKDLTKDVDLIYCFGPFDNYAYKTMILKRFSKIRQTVVIASMGVFSKGAIKIKQTKKKIFLSICKFFGLFKKIKWSVTSSFEEQDVKRCVGKKAECYIAEDLPRKIPNLEKLSPTSKLKGVFISRICEMKNLEGAIKILTHLKREVSFDIYGVIEDVSYWDKCKKIINEMPPNVKITYKGMLNSEEVVETFSQYNFFLFPTFGENYGHVIFESLAGGCIPIISDQTPWQDFEEKDCGWIVPLDNQQRFVDIIENFTTEQIIQQGNNSRVYAENKYIESINNTGYRKVFEL